MILREQLGISADGSEAVYRSDDIEAFVKREPGLLTWTDRDHRQNIEHFFTAVDPSGGGPSAFAICSVICLPNGSIQVRLVKHGKRQRQGQRYIEPIAGDALVLVQQTERATEANERIRALTQVLDKGWSDQRENAFGKILNQCSIALVELCRKLRLLPKRKEQHGPLASNVGI